MAQTMKFSSLYEWLKLYMETILEIIEDKPTFRIPKFVYCFLIVLLFFHLSGYVMSNYEEIPMSEQKGKFLARVYELSPLTFLLYVKGNDSLTIFTFVLLSTIMYSYFIYIAVLTFLKHEMKDFYATHKKSFQSINQVLNIFFTFFWWSSLTPFTEINSSTLFCNSNSFLLGDRDGDCSGKTPAFYIFPICGLILTICTGLIIIYFFRNYEFNEPNLLKRRFHSVLVLQLMCRFSLTFFYYMNVGIGKELKHVIAAIMGLSFFYDTLINWPFGDYVIGRFFAAGMCFYEVSTILSHIWIFRTSSMPATEYFNNLLLFGLVSAAAVGQIWEMKYNAIMSRDRNGWFSIELHDDFYLEEIVRLLQESVGSEEYKLRLNSTLNFHKNTCLNVECSCHSTLDFKSGVNSKTVDPELVFKMIDCTFKYNLKSPRISRDKIEFEHLSLKYISYLAKYRDNASTAYYELKSLLASRSNNVSFYFQIISKILSRTIETQLEITVPTKSLASSGSGSSQTGEEGVAGGNRTNDVLPISQIWRIEEFKNQFLPKIVFVLREKLAFWQHVKHGFTSIQSCFDYSIRQIRKIEEIDALFQQEIARLSDTSKNSFLFKRIRALFELLVKNQVATALKLENQAIELHKRDMPKPNYCLHNASVFKQNVLSILVSYSKDKGRIISKKQPFICKFVGYDHGDEAMLQNVNDLLPRFMQAIHFDLMDNIKRRGNSKFIGGNISSYIADKNGFIFPVKVYLDYSFGHFDDFCLLSSITKIQTSTEYIVFDGSGRILGITKSLFSKLSRFERTLTVDKLYRSGIVYLMVRELLEKTKLALIQTQKTSGEDSVGFLFNTPLKSNMNLDYSFEHLFDAFNIFMKKKHLGALRTMNPRMTQAMQGSTFKGLQKSMKSDLSSPSNLSSSNSSGSSNNGTRDLLDPQFAAYFDEFRKQYIPKRVENINLSRRNSFYNPAKPNNQPNSPSRHTSVSSSVSASLRLFLKYQIRYEVLRFNSTTKPDLPLFHMMITETMLSRKKSDRRNDNMSMNTFNLSSQAGNGINGTVTSSIRLRSDHVSSKNSQPSQNSMPNVPPSPMELQLMTSIDGTKPKNLNSMKLKHQLSAPITLTDAEAEYDEAQEQQEHEKQQQLQQHQEENVHDDQEQIKSSDWSQIDENESSEEEESSDKHKTGKARGHHRHHYNNHQQHRLEAEAAKQKATSAVQEYNIALNDVNLSNLNNQLVVSLAKEQSTGITQQLNSNNQNLPSSNHVIGTTYEYEYSSFSVQQLYTQEVLQQQHLQQQQQQHSQQPQQLTTMNYYENTTQSKLKEPNNNSTLIHFMSPNANVSHTTSATQGGIQHLLGELVADGNITSVGGAGIDYGLSDSHVQLFNNSELHNPNTSRSNVNYTNRQQYPHDISNIEGTFAAAALKAGDLSYSAQNKSNSNINNFHESIYSSRLMDSIRNNRAELGDEIDQNFDVSIPRIKKGNSDSHSNEVYNDKQLTKPISGSKDPSGIIQQSNNTNKQMQGDTNAKSNTIKKTTSSTSKKVKDMAGKTTRQFQNQLSGMLKSKKLNGVQQNGAAPSAAGKEKKAKRKTNLNGSHSDEEDNENNTDNQFERFDNFDEEEDLDKVSTYSSVRSSIGQQLASEILNKRRLPNGARMLVMLQWAVLLTIMVILLSSYIFIATEIQQIVTDMSLFTTYANLTNSYSKGLLASIGMRSIRAGIVDSTSSSEATAIAVDTRRIYTENIDNAAKWYSRSFDLLAESISEFNLQQTPSIRLFDYMGKTSELKISNMIVLHEWARNSMRKESETFLNDISNPYVTQAEVAYYFLRNNYATFLDETSNVWYSQEDLVDEDVKSVNVLFSVWATLSTGICCCFVVVGFFAIKQINTYKEKVLLLVTRVKFTDVEGELSKYSACIEKLQNTDEETCITVDFFKLFSIKRSNPFGHNGTEYNQSAKANVGTTAAAVHAAENIHNRLKQKKWKGLITELDLNQKRNRSPGAAGNNPKNIQLKSSVKNVSDVTHRNHLVSSKIYEQKLSIIGSFFQFFFTISMAVAFFIGVLVYVVSSDAAISPTLDISRHAFLTSYALGSFYVASELLAVEPTLAINEHTYPEVTLEVRQSLLDLVNHDFEVMNAFLETNMNSVYGVSSISEAQLIEIRNLYQGSLCESIGTAKNCKEFEQGLSGVVARIKVLQRSFQAIYEVDHMPSKDEAVEFVNSSEHRVLLRDAYEACNIAFTRLQEITISANIDVVNKIEDTVKVLVMGIGLSILFIIGIMFAWSGTQLNAKLRSLNFLLIFIPEESITSEITVQILKTLKNF